MSLFFLGFSEKYTINFNIKYRPMIKSGNQYLKLKLTTCTNRKQPFLFFVKIINDDLFFSKAFFTNMYFLNYVLFLYLTY